MQVTDAFLLGPSRFTPLLPSLPRSMMRATNPDKQQMAFGRQKETMEQQQEEINWNMNVNDFNELNECNSRTRACNIIINALEKTDSPKFLFDSVTIPQGEFKRGMSKSELALQTNIRGDIMDYIDLVGNKDMNRATLGLLGVFLGSTLSSLVVNQWSGPPEIVRFILVWILCFAPLFYVGLGLSVPDRLQNALIQIQRQLFPTYRTRILQHEAGHFLIGHLLGFPVKGYSAHSIQNSVEFHPLNDPEVGRDLARKLGFETADNIQRQQQEKRDVAYFSKEGRGGSIMERQSVFANRTAVILPPENDPTKSWPFRGLNDETVDKLTAISVAGVCAELLAFGNAQGGYADFAQLRQFIEAAEEEQDDKERVLEKKIRHGLGFVMGTLRLHLNTLDALADAMERDASVAECVYIIETQEQALAEQDDETKTTKKFGSSRTYEQERREKFQSQEMNWIEKLLLQTTGNNANDEDLAFSNTNQRGDNQNTNGVFGFAIREDDVFTAAVGVSLLFLAWAFNGGISLH